jgi:hypothetical protein
MIRPLILNPCNFVCKLTASQYTFNQLPLEPIVKDEVVTIHELIKIQISNLPTNHGMYISSLPWLNGAAQNNKNILFCTAVASATNALSTMTFDFTDQRGNGIMFAGTALCFACYNTTGGTVTFFCNVLTRQRDISMTEYIQICNKFKI